VATLRFYKTLVVARVRLLLAVAFSILFIQIYSELILVRLTRLGKFKKVSAGFAANLTAGTYWITFEGFDGGGSGPWAPYLSTTGPGAQQASGSANAMRLDGAWAPVTSGGLQQDLPFVVYGSVPEPGSMIALGLGAAALLARRRRKKA